MYKVTFTGWPKNGTIFVRLNVSYVDHEELNHLRFLASSATLASLLSRTPPIACIGVMQIFYLKSIFEQFEN